MIMFLKFMLDNQLWPVWKIFNKWWYEKVTSSPKGKFQFFFSKKEPDKDFRKWIQTWCSKIWNNTSKIFSPYGQQGSWTLQSYSLASGCLHPYMLKCFDAWQLYMYWILVCLFYNVSPSTKEDMNYYSSSSCKWACLH